MLCTMVTGINAGETGKVFPMIDLYTWPTPNGHKMHIMLEETGLEYRVIPVNIGKGDQFKPDFLKIAPNNRMPAMVDRDGPGGAPYSMFESGAMLIYLAEKTGKFMPTEPRARYTVLQWLMFQMGNIGPMMGQTHHFRHYAPEKIAYATQRYTNEAGRLYRVVEKRLSESPWLGGEDYSIADIAAFPWLRNPERKGQDSADFPKTAAWMETIEARPAVERALQVLAEHQSTGKFDAKARENLFGAKQFGRH